MDYEEMIDDIAQTWIEDGDGDLTSRYDLDQSNTFKDFVDGHTNTTLAIDHLIQVDRELEDAYYAFLDQIQQAVYGDVEDRIEELS